MRKSHHDPEKRQEALAMVLTQGKSQTDTARILGVPVQTINAWVKAEGIGHAEGDAETQGEKLNFASIAFGAVLAELRKDRSTGKIRSTDDFARQLKIGGSSLRMLEIGKHVPQVNLAYPLSMVCNLGLPITVLVIGFVRTVDTCESVGLSLKVASEFLKQEPRLSFFVKKIFEVEKNNIINDQKAYLREDVFVGQIIELLRSKQRLDFDGSEYDSIFYQLSPVVYDAIRTLTSNLYLFHPALDAKSLDEWESNNSHRIKRVYSYYTDKLNLVKTIKSFRWDFLSRSKAQKLQYFVFAENADKEFELAVIDRIKIAKPELKNISDHVFVAEKPLPVQIQGKFSKALEFDTETQSTGLSTDAPTVNSILKMTTINMYEIETNNRITTVAFIDNSVPDSQGINYARALSTIDTSKIKKLFEDAFSELVDERI